jgi:DNA-binding CsgD family transcriptional regulator
MRFVAKLSKTEKEEVLLHYEIGRPLKEIATDFGLHPAYVRILARRNGVNWINRRVNWKRWLEFEKELDEDAICIVDLNRTPILRDLLTHG